MFTFPGIMSENTCFPKKKHYSVQEQLTGSWRPKIHYKIKKLLANGHFLQSSLQEVPRYFHGLLSKRAGLPF